MTNSPVIVDITFQQEATGDYNQLLHNQAASSGHFQSLAQKSNLHVIRLINGEATLVKDGVKYHFFKGSPSKTWLPFKLNRFVNSLKPTVILAHGFSHPLQLFLLILQTRTPVVIQYHGGGVPAGIRGVLQKLIKLFVKDYVFTAKEQADSFIERGLITPHSRIHEILEGSTAKMGMEQQIARERLKIPQKLVVFLWVGRLISNKDPLTVIHGLRKNLTSNPDSELWLIYQDDTLLPQIQNLLSRDAALSPRVKLIGAIPHEQLDVYYSAANYYVSGSFYEGSGYSLFEAMACGCVPLVTDIPSFRIMTDRGNIGALWEPGKPDSLERTLDELLAKNYIQESHKSRSFFKLELSFEAIGKRSLEMINDIIQRKSK